MSTTDLLLLLLLLLLLFTTPAKCENSRFYFTFRRVSVQVLVQEKIFYDIYILIIPI